MVTAADRLAACARWIVHRLRPSQLARSRAVALFLVLAIAFPMTRLVREARRRALP